MADHGTAEDRAAFDRALEWREQGRRPDAVRACEQIVARSPAFAPALHLLGFMALEDGQLDRAARYLPAAVRADPADAAIHHSLGLLFRAGAKPADAAMAFRAASRIDPRHVAALNGLGLSLLDLGDGNAAAEAFSRALQVDPRHAESRHNLGLALERSGRLEAAEAAWRQALEDKPALLPPRFALARSLLQRDRAGEAEPHLRACLEGRPDWPEALGALALSLEGQGRDAEAEASLRGAHDPSHPAIQVNLANLLARAGRLEEALDLYDAALLRHPRDPVAHHNRGNALAAMGRVDEAAAQWEQAIALAPGYPDPHFALSQRLLARGELERGWAEFAWRPLELPSWMPREGLSRIGQPGVVERARDAQAVELVEEQGLGDVVFFLQWAPWLLDRGWRVVLRVGGRLSPLLSRAGGFEVRAPLDAPLGVELVALPIADLPRLVLALGGPALPPGPLRIEPLPDRLQAARQALAEAGPAPYTGFTWRAGVPRRVVGRAMLSKEVDPEALWLDLDAPGTLVAMQRGLRPGELEGLRRFAPCVADFASWTDDLESLVGLLAALDGYAGVSNTNVHLLAMLGRRATIAVPFPHEWRWSGDGASRWFPGFRVLRQSPGEPWSSTLARERGRG